MKRRALLAAIVPLTAGCFSGTRTQADEPTETPNAAFDFDADRSEGSVTIEHQSGDTIEANDLLVVVEGVDCSGSDDPNGRYNVDDDFKMGPDEMTSGMSIRYGQDIDIDGTDELCPGGDLSVSGATFHVVWTPPDGNSVTLRTWTV